MGDRNWTFDDQGPRFDKEHREAYDRGEKICRECGKPVEGRRQSWCSDDCVQAYKKRARPIREIVFERDRGICAKCGADRSLDGRWDANHKVPLVEGGSNTLDNTETLCRDTCHKEETAKLRERLKGRPRPRKPKKPERKPPSIDADVAAIARAFGLNRYWLQVTVDHPSARRRP